MMRALEAIWWRARPGPLARLAVWLLAVPELLYRLVVAVRAALFGARLLPAARATVPVVSVGNVAVGGAGKTPVVLALAERLAARGRRVAILSRGYGATRADPRVVSDGARVLLDAVEGGDEPVLLARRLPGARVLCAPRRADLLPLAAGADVLLLDDGFQHRALARDLDVVVLDASSPFGNGHLLPAGPNREPRAALRRAGLVWLTRVDQADPAALDALRELARAATGRAPVESRHAVVDVVDGALARSLGKDALRGSRAALLSGIAKPASFRRTVEALGAVVIAEHVFADHHRFSHADVLGALGSAEWLVTTEKDAVRVPADLVADPRLRVVRIAAEVVRGGEVLDEALSAMLNSHPDPTRSVASPSASSRTA
jgi:tetraacyldisaccharide 4'-kinase